MKLNAKNFGLAGGIIWGGAVSLLAISSMFGYGTEILNLLASLYIGVKPSLLGSLLALGYGFIDGFIGCWLFAWIYNKLVKK